jgi:glycosyltransferase involved in cell wall biosynthesis
MAERNTMADELSKAALFVLLSEFETHPIAVLEAVSLGVPALVADTSGLSELAKLGMAQSIPLRKDGREISEREIAQAMNDQLDHPHLPASQDLPTWDDCAGELLRLYQSIIGSR